MDSVVIGVDPDCDKHGVAAYINEELDRICNLSTIDLLDLIRDLQGSALTSMLLVIEDVKANSFTYGRNNPAIKKSRNPCAVAHNMGTKVGKNQQSQIELQRWLDHYQVKYINIKPMAGNWSNHRAQFEKVTGWTGRSNFDNRSAAFFGWLGLKKVNK